jgi:hypothetical protein
MTAHATYAITIEERLARIGALTVAMHCVAAAGDDCQGDTVDVCGYLAQMARDELAKVEALDASVLTIST